MDWLTIILLVLAAILIGTIVARIPGMVRRGRETVEAFRGVGGDELPTPTRQTDDPDRKDPYGSGPGSAD